MTSCLDVTKKGLATVRILFFTTGLILLLIGALLLREHWLYGTALKPAVAVLVISFMALALALCGCARKCRDRKYATTQFIAILVMLWWLIVGGLYHNTFSADISKGLHAQLRNHLDTYFDNKDTRALTDLVQTSFKCCGVDAVSDWLNTTWYYNQSINPLPYPQSCCTPDNCTYIIPDSNLYNTTCYYMFEQELQRHIVVVAVSLLGFTGLLVTGLTLSCSLLVIQRRISRDISYHRLSNPDGAVL